MVHVQARAQALVARRQQVLDRGERRRLDEVDHHRRGQHAHHAAADARRGVLLADHELRRPFEARGDAQMSSPSSGWKRAPCASRNSCSRPWRSAKISLATATGQNWPYWLLIPATLSLRRRTRKFTICT